MTKSAPAKSEIPRPAIPRAASTVVGHPPGGEQDLPAALNLAVVRGTVSSPPDVRLLPSGTLLVQLQVTTRLPAETLTMPVACWNPPAWVESLDSGDEIVVVGRVRRRFFRSGGATASRVELEADVVARASDRRRVRAVARRANALLETLDS